MLKHLPLVFILVALQSIYSSSSLLLKKDETRLLRCIFKGWPLPRVIWYKERKPILNGSEGFYHSEKKLWNSDLVTLQSTLHLPPGREEYDGLYTCTAENNIPGWSSNQSSKIWVTYHCKCSGFFPAVNHNNCSHER